MYKKSRIFISGASSKAEKILAQSVEIARPFDSRIFHAYLTSKDPNMSPFCITSITMP